jgi:hypothetical protein
LNPRPSGYEPDELPGCSTPRFFEETHNALTAELAQPFLKKIFQAQRPFLSRGVEEQKRTKFPILNPRSGSCRIMSLTSYQAAPPRVFEETRNAFSSTPTQPFFEEILARPKKTATKV